MGEAAKSSLVFALFVESGGSVMAPSGRDPRAALTLGTPDTIPKHPRLRRGDRQARVERGGVHGRATSASRIAGAILVEAKDDA
jgi:hypothetical protein